MTLDEAFAKLRELNQPVPKPMRLPQTAEVSVAEKRLGVKFHPDFRRYLLEVSDVVYGTLEPVTLTVRHGPQHLPDVCQTAWEECDIPKELMPICEDNGEFYCMNAKGEIVFNSEEAEPQDRWPSLADWIEKVWIGESEEE